MPGLHRWWADLDSERYWMEITDRSDLGADLFAPQVDDAGRAYWSYNLVTEVRVGDIVLHWHKTLMGAPAMVGWSIVDGPPGESEIIWQARGTVGRSAPPSGLEPAWLIPLIDYTPLLEPIYQDELRREERQLRSIKAELEEEHGDPLYFPFAFSVRRPVRTTQGYLVKYPSAAVSVFDELASVPQAPIPVRPPPQQPRPVTAAGRYQNDPRVRAAVERHAVTHAIDHYVDNHFTVDDVGGVESYDLRVSRGTEARRVEVKGLTGPVVTVELTAAEVSNAQNYQPTDLYIVSEIEWSREPDGSVATDGGRVRLLRDWTPRDVDLAATRYRYSVPHEA